MKNLALFVHQAFLDDFIDVVEGMGYIVIDTKEFQMFSGTSILVTLTKHPGVMDNDDQDIIRTVISELRHHLL